MQPAADVMASELARVEMHAPVVPLVANVTAQPTQDIDQIRDQLVAQVTATVRWRESVETMIAEGVDTFYEIGVGKVLSGLVGRIDRNCKATTVGSPEDIAAVVPELAG